MKKYSKKINRKKDADLLLVKRAKKGDYRAFDLLVLKYQSRLINLSFGLVKDKYLAEDITQETFIKAYQSLKSFREESAFFTWLYRIASNTAKNYLSSLNNIEFKLMDVYRQRWQFEENVDVIKENVNRPITIK